MNSLRNKSLRTAKPSDIITGVPIETSGGTFFASFTDKGLSELSFPKSGSARRSAPNLSPQMLKWQKTIASTIEALLNGRVPRELPPLDWSGATDFRRSVWNALLKISPGKTRTYSEIAKSIGAPGAARAVGNACGANPIPVLVPCHRVLASGGKLGGFSGGLDWKRRLLAAEAAPLLSGSRN